jgi:hypothetical protein
MIIERPASVITPAREPMMTVDRTKWNRRRSWLVVALSLLIALQAAPPVWAWGRLGHRVIARFAERHLTPAAKEAIAGLLEPGESLADASTWADEHRRELPKTTPWHDVDVPLEAPRYDDRFAGDEPAKGYIIPKIREFKAILKDHSRPVEKRRFALRFLVHLVEDLQMPLHVGENQDKGGNKLQVRWFDQGSNHHRVWDSGIIEQAGRGEDGWLADLVEMDTVVTRSLAQAGSVEDWATESLLAARAAYQDPATGRRIKPGAKLGDAYQERNLPVVKQRLYQAGVRLARVLNEVWPE